jgi:cytochrome oxidase Cu insertion factor (SCO1/SenC/PrrC family)
MIRRAARPSSARMPLRRATLVVCLASAAGVGVGVALHELKGKASPASAAAPLPTLHGQAVWEAGARRAPPISLRDQLGAQVSLPVLRGRPMVLTFMDSRCKEQCPIEGRQLASVLRSLPAEQRPTLVVVSVDPSGDTPESIRHATAKWGLAGPWRWHWLRGSPRQLAAVWRRYRVTVDLSSGDIVHSLVLYLIDREGYERTAYLYPFLPSFVRGDLARLASQT